MQRIPNGFTGKYGGDMSNPMFLKTPDGRKSKIYWTKIDGDIWFVKGWKEFATHYSLDHGHMVLFEYDEKTTHFGVHIFDESTLEIEYNFHGSQGEQNNSDQISGDSIEISDEAPQCKKRRPNSPMPCPQPHKKLRINTSEDVGTSSKVQNLPTIDILDDVFQSKKGRPKSPMSSPQPHKKLKTDESEDGGRNAKLQNFPNNVRVKECLKVEKEPEPLTSNIAEALHTARNFRSPTFTVVMLSTFVNQHLYVPSKFAKTYFKTKQSDILLQVLDERTWLVKYHLGRIEVGWKTFALDNNLKVGDVCVFELAKSQALTLKVLIFRLGEKTHSPPPQDSVQGDEVNWLDPEKMLNVESKTIISSKVSKATRRNSLEDSPLSFTYEALNEANKFTSENPSFRITVNTEPPIRKVHVPKLFTRKYFEKKKQNVMLKVQEKMWPVKLLCYPYKTSNNFSRGWPRFVQECKLQTGDVCVFELINREDAVLDVHIFRSKSFMTNKGGKETPTTSLQTRCDSFTYEALKEPHSPPPQFQVDGVNQFDPANLPEVENKNIISGKGSKESRRNSLGTSPLSFTNEALIEAKKFTSDNPFFTIVINLEPHRKPYVPKPFTRKYFEKNQIVMLKVQEKMWPVKLLWYPYKTSNNFSRGWPLFVQDSKLKTGDVCVFELINRKYAVLDVHIFRSKSIMTNKDRKETLRTSLQTRCDSFTNEALKEAKKFTSENPFFMVSIRPNRPGKKYSPHVPNPFIRNYMHSKTQIVKLQFGKKLWPVNCLFYPCKQQSGSLGSGWNLFAEENKLQAGDVCVFELISKEDVVLDVHIFRGHS